MIMVIISGAVFFLRMCRIPKNSDFFFGKIHDYENELIIQNHPLSCYTSKRIDYSAKLNEILSQKELSSKIIIDNGEDEENNHTMLSKDLGK